MMKRCEIAWLLMFLSVMSVAWAAGEHDGHPHAAATVAEPAAEIWTCSMHPQIRMNRPGQCPICQMDLVPLAAQSTDPAVETLPEITLSSHAEKLAEVSTAKVERKFVPHELLLTGRIDYDETALAHIALRFPGRIDRLYVNYTGISVRKGDHIAEVFSPELIVMQREYLQELNASRSAAVKPAAKPLRVDDLEAVRSKMRLWGFGPEQIAAIGEKGEISEHLTIQAPIDGTVIAKNIVTGQYFGKEENLFTIADLTKLWLVLDVYESDLRYLYYGQRMAFRVDAWPETVFSGRVAHINPVLNSRTRTVPVRINLDNRDGKLKPGMYARAEAYALLDGQGKIIDDSLAGKWISPMHPEVIRDAPGSCDVCGMALVSAESLGIGKSSGQSDAAPLVIPSSAPLITGRRAVVYVKTGPGRYAGRQVVLGPRAGEYYIVASGLREGEEVVTSGAMKIDGALQIAGRRSMTSSENFDSPAAADDAAGAIKTLDPVYRDYFAIHRALVDGDEKTAAAGFAALRRTVAALPDTGGWTAHRRELLDLLPEPPEGALALQRALYAKLSKRLIDLAKALRLKENGMKLHFFFCPMAFDNQGGDWLQESAGIENPYFGDAMLNCGVEK